jgi:capsid protein
MIEFSLINGVLAKSDLPHQWFWDGMEHVDPKKEAEAQKIRLGNGTTNQSIEYARQGRDWETERRQAHKEKMLEIELEMELEATKQKLMKKYKITEDPTNENK